MSGPTPWKWTPYLLSILRIIAGFLFIAHGTQKIWGVPAIEAQNAVDLSSRMGAAGMIEVVCGGLLIVGLFTRLAAFVASGEMAFAYFLVHASTSFWPLLNRGEVAVLFSFAFLYIASAGPGPWSLDALWQHLKHRMPRAIPKPSPSSQLSTESFARNRAVL